MAADADSSARSTAFRERLRRQRDRSLFRPPRNGHLRHVPERFLYRNVQGALTRRFLSPWNWVRLVSPTSAAATSWLILDELIFEGKTYADLLAAETARDHYQRDRFRCRHAIRIRSGSVRPVVLGHRGLPFGKSGGRFVGRAARPVADHNRQLSERAVRLRATLLGRRRCTERRSVVAALSTSAANSTLRAARRYALCPLGGRRTCGQSRPARSVRQSHPRRRICSLVELTGYTRFRRVLHIVVNAQQETRRRRRRGGRGPGTDRNSEGRHQTDAQPLHGFETVENFKRELDGWMQELKDVRCAPGAVRMSRGPCVYDLEDYFVELFSHSIPIRPNGSS